MRGSIPKAAVLAALLAASLGATASGVEICVTPLCVSATATMQPRELPRRGNAPISLTSIVRVRTEDGSTPPTLKTIVFLLDKHGTVDTKDLPRCTPAMLADTTTAEARKRCAGALVGKGTGKALVTMPGEPPFTIASALSFFNGPPSGGRPTLIAHARESVPVPKTLLVPITIEHVAKGRYGFRARVEMPEIAGGYGAPTLAEASIGATRRRDGRRVGYINAHCSGGRLQVYGTMTFANGDFFPTTLTSPCHIPR